MALKIGPCSCVSSTLRYTTKSKINLSCGFFEGLQFDAKSDAKVMKACQLMHGMSSIKGIFSKGKYKLRAAFEDNFLDSDVEPDAIEKEDNDENLISVDLSLEDGSYIYSGGHGGRPGFITFYNRSNRNEKENLIPSPKKKQNDLLWFVGPAVLVASFVFPSLYLRKILSAVFEDSLLTDFLILFFTEALFYCGVAVFLLLVDRLRRPVLAYHENPNPKLAQRISSVTVLVLSLIIPLVTMGFVWPWTGPAASATLAPYLVGIVVQFAFEQYTKRMKSPSLPVVPVIFQVYRLHQLNRAAQLVTALSFTVRGAEMTPHNLAINSSLGTLLNVLQLLGVICIWSLSSFLMRFTPSVSPVEQ